MQAVIKELPVLYSTLSNILVILDETQAGIKIARYTDEKTLWHKAAAAIAAKSLQSCPTLCDPIDGSPPGSLVPWILQARTLEWVAISFSNA